MRISRPALVLSACLTLAASSVRAHWGAPKPDTPAADLADYLNGGGKAAAKTLPKEIVLYVYGGADPKFEFSSRMNAAVDYTPNLVHVRVEGGAELALRLGEILKAGSRITKLVIDAHGAPGLTEAVDRSDLPRFKGLDAVFAPNTDIIFHSCSVAEGAEGRRFLKDVGATLLTKGGTVTAATGTFYFYGDRTSRTLMPDVEGFSPKGWLRYSAAPGGGGTFTYIPVGVQEVGEKGDARLRQAEALAKSQARVDRFLAGAGVDAGAKAADLTVRADEWCASNCVRGAEIVAQAHLDVKHRVLREGVKSFSPALVPAVDQAHKAATQGLRAATARVQGTISRGAALTRKGIAVLSSETQKRLDDVTRLREAGIRAAGNAARRVWKAEVYGRFETAQAGVQWTKKAAARASSWGAARLKEIRSLF